MTFAPKLDDEEWEEDEEYEYDTAPDLKVWLEPNPVVSVLYGPKGEVVQEWTEREVIDFGFQVPEKEESETISSDPG